MDRPATAISAGANTIYATTKSDGVTLFFDNIGAFATNFTTSNTGKQVTDPASTGARIVSAQGGATRNWAYKHASFDSNAASTYKVLFIGD